LRPQIDCTIRVRPFLTVARNRTYSVHVAAQTTLIPTLNRMITIVAV
jgi:hypothetical protein